VVLGHDEHVGVGCGNAFAPALGVRVLVLLQEGVLCLVVNGQVEVRQVDEPRVETAVFDGKAMQPACDRWPHASGTWADNDSVQSGGRHGCLLVGCHSQYSGAGAACLERKPRTRRSAQADSTRSHGGVPSSAACRWVTRALSFREG